jgi:hypothetical protein
MGARFHTLDCSRRVGRWFAAPEQALREANDVFVEVTRVRRRVIVQIQ